MKGEKGHGRTGSESDEHHDQDPREDAAVPRRRGGGSLSRREGRRRGPFSSPRVVADIAVSRPVLELDRIEPALGEVA